LAENAKLVFMRPRPVPHSLRERIEDELNFLVENQILEPITTSQWAVPIVPVLKSNGSVRICGDFKTSINRQLEVDQYPFPLISDILDKLSEGKLFSKIDIRQAYLHIEVVSDSSEFLVINTHKGLFRFKRLPYGIWQRTIEKVLHGLEAVCVFMDDIIVTGATNEIHKKRLLSVLERLSENNLRINV